MADIDESVPTEHVFHFRDGKKAHNLKDLRDALEVMSADEFAHHVDDANNDFANWVEFVYRNPSLASDLRKANTDAHMVEIIDVELGRYGGQGIDDEPVPEPLAAHSKHFDVQPQEVDPKKQLFEKPITLTHPPQVITTHTGEQIATISTEAAHKFIIKEMVLGFFAGLMLGIIFMGTLAFYGVI